MRHAFGLTAAAASVVLGLPVPAATAAGAATTLHVDNTAADCTDQGGGTFARPYCTISAAAAVVQPGQTVRVWAGDYKEDVRVTRSGTPEQPITFLGGRVDTAPFLSQPTVRGAQNGTAFALNNVHDIAVRGFRIAAPHGLQVVHSSSVVVDQNQFHWNLNTVQDSLRVVGGSSHVTVSRNSFNHSSGAFVGEGGGSDLLVTGNDFDRTTTTGLVVNGVSDAAVTNNTFALSCNGSVDIQGLSPRSVVKNNIAVDGNQNSATANPKRCWTVGGYAAQITVSPESAGTASVDYNVVHARSGTQPYRWASSTYESPAEFAAATGRGTHDLDLDLEFSASSDQRPFNLLTEASAGAIDSADPTAPGVGTDQFGQPAIDDPNVTGTGTRDRGAHELNGLDGGTALVVHGAAGGSTTGPAPFTVNATVRARSAWAGPGSRTVDFGDGTEPVTSDQETVPHTYTAPGTYTVTATATDALGGRAEGALFQPVRVNAPSGLTTDFTATSVGWPYVYRFDLRSSSGYLIPAGSVDFGDGSRAYAASGPVEHTFAGPGTYRVTFTVRDESGESSTTTKAVEVGPYAPVAVLQPGERVQVLARTPASVLNGGAHYGYGLWAPLTPAGPGGPGARPFNEGDINSSAIGTTADGVVHNVVAAKGRIFIADRRMSDGGWSGWGELTTPDAAGPLATAPQQIAVAAMGDKLHVLALRDGRVFQATGDWSTGSWSRWADVSTTVGAGTLNRISAAVTGDTLHIAGISPDNRVFVADGDYGRGTWGYGEPSALIGKSSEQWPTAFTATAIGSTLHILVAHGTTVHQASGDYAAGEWSGWGDLTAAIGPIGTVERLSATSTGNKLRLYALADGGVLRDATGDYDRGAWSGWGNVSAAVGAPALTDLAVTAS
ncbi:PKD domain-containing protein [Kitasatospora sp. cg17-2]